MRERHQENRRMQARHHDGRGARIERFAPLAPQLEGDEERIDRDDDRAERDRARCCSAANAGNWHSDEPDDGAGECSESATGGGRGTAARRSRSCRRRRKISAAGIRCGMSIQRRGRAPQRHRRGADQIGRAPPGQRPHVALLHPGEDQQQPEQRGDTDRHEGQRRHVQRRQLAASLQRAYELPIPRRTVTRAARLNNTHRLMGKALARLRGLR